MIAITIIAVVAITVAALFIKDEDARPRVILGICGVLFLIYTHVGVYKMGVSITKDAIATGRLELPQK